MSPKYSMNGAESFGISESTKEAASGCRVSFVAGFILLLLSMVIAVGVGIIVHFAGAKELVCVCDGGVTKEPDWTPSHEALTQMCIGLIESNEGADICATCPSTTIGTVPPSSPTVKPTSPTVTPTIPITSPPATSTPTSEPENYRLPITVLPILYDLTIQPNIYEGEASLFNFNGSVIIHTQAQTVSDTIVLHAHATLALSSLSVMDSNDNVELFAASSYESPTQFLTLYLSQDLTPGRNYTIKIDFRGPLATDGRGFYLSSYQENGTTVYLATTQFQAPDARKAFPCFDEPALKARFDISVIRQENGIRKYRSLSNNKQKLEGHDISVPNMVMDIYERTVIMPTYLVAFIVCDYEFVETDVSGTMYRTWAMPGRINFTQKAQTLGVDIFRKYTEHFTPVYVYDKLDNIAIPDFGAGAMENWGLITYRDVMLYEPGVSSAGDENWIGVVVSHEIAHMWFGNIVTADFWSNLWLNEGLASFWDYHILTEIYEDWKSLDLYVSRDMHGVMNSDALQSSHPLTNEVKTTADFSPMFSGVTYSKGSAIVRMMHLILGQDMLISGLNRYLNQHAYGNTVYLDILDALTQESGINMTAIMEPWIIQKNYPVVNVTLDRTAKTMTLTQDRFLLIYDDTITDDAPFDYRWTIPITYTTSVNPDFEQVFTHSTIHYMLHNDTQPLVIPISEDIPDGGWVIVNIKESGYFRVNYDEDNWNNIINFLINDNHSMIHPINRAQIINDANTLANAGLLAPQIALNATRFLYKDNEYAPWRALIRELGNIEEMLEYTPDFHLFQKFMNKTVGGPFRELGLDLDESRPPVERMTISMLASQACRHDVIECVDAATSSFRHWMQNPSDNQIPTDLRSVFYCTAVRHGGNAEWAFALDRFRIEDATSEMNRLRFALTCSKELVKLSLVLEMAISPSVIRPQDTASTIAYVAESRWGRDLAWHFFVDYFDYLKEVVTSITGLSRLVSGVTQKFTTTRHLQWIENFVNSRDDLAGTAGAFEQAVDRTKKNIAWMQSNYDVIVSWLNEEVN